jgi:hypothetical protein
MDDPVPEVRVEAVRACAQVITAGEEYTKLARVDRVKVGQELVGKICQVRRVFYPGLQQLLPLAYILIAPLSSPPERTTCGPRRSSLRSLPRK